MVSPEDNKSFEGRRAFPGGLRPLQQAEGLALVFHASEDEWEGRQNLWKEERGIQDRGGESQHGNEPGKKEEEERLKYIDQFLTPRIKLL